MPFSEQAIAQIAHLARLPGENTRDMGSIQDDLNKIVKMIDQIKAVDTQTLSPMAHPLELSQPMRLDEVTKEDNQEALIQLAPQAEAGFYLVPLVLEEETKN